MNMWEAMPGTADEGGGGGKDERIDDLEAKEKELPFHFASKLNVYHLSRSHIDHKTGKVKDSIPQSRVPAGPQGRERRLCRLGLGLPRGRPRG